jgi:hypothetical protein
MAQGKIRTVSVANELPGAVARNLSGFEVGMEAPLSRTNVPREIRKMKFEEALERTQARTGLRSAPNADEVLNASRGAS